MPLHVVAVNENILKIDHYEFVYERLENLVYHPYKCAWGVGQTKRHDKPFKSRPNRALDEFGGRLRPQLRNINGDLFIKKKKKN